MAIPDAWGTRAGNSPELLMGFQDELPVQLIATPRRAFKTCHIDASLADVVQGNMESFDFMPVIKAGKAARDTVVGLIDLVPFLQGEAPSGLVRDRMQLLSEDTLIGADASILTFIQDADRHRCRLVVSGSEISGLVSLYDLQKLPVRAALFAMLTHAEMSMTDAIRRELGKSDEWIDRLSAGRQEKILDEIQKSKKNNTFVDSLLFTQFVDKTAIIRKSPLFILSKTSFEKETKSAEELRNYLVHANDYTSTRAAAEKVCETVRSIGRWTNWIISWPNAVP